MEEEEEAAEGVPSAAAHFSLTRLMLNFSRSAAYYTPRDEGSSAGQIVLAVGSLKVGSNIHSDTGNQGFKISARDGAFHVLPSTSPQPATQLLHYLQRYAEAVVERYRGMFQPGGGSTATAAPRDRPRSSTNDNEEDDNTNAFGELQRPKATGGAKQTFVPLNQLLVGDLSAVVSRLPNRGRRARVSPRPADVKVADSDDIQDQLESIGFLRVVTLDGIDVFIKSAGKTGERGTPPLTSLPLEAHLHMTRFLVQSHHRRHSQR